MDQTLQLFWSCHNNIIPYNLMFFRLMTNKMQANYSLRGRGAKEAFDDLEMYQVVLGTV